MNESNRTSNNESLLGLGPVQEENCNEDYVGDELDPLKLVEPWPSLSPGYPAVFIKTESPNEDEARESETAEDFQPNLSSVTEGRKADQASCSTSTQRGLNHPSPPGKKTLYCAHCTYSCFYNSVLAVHVRTHTGEKPFQCPYCSFKCSLKVNLASHVRKHTGERPFECPHCPFSCSFKSSLISHIRTHTGEKPFVCPHCCFTCSFKSSLASHVRSHTGEKPFKCPYCPATYSHRITLTRHLRTHTGEKPFKCPHCSFTCSQNGNLGKHVRRRHAGVDYETIPSAPSPPP